MNVTGNLSINITDFNTRTPAYFGVSFFAGGSEIDRSHYLLGHLTTMLTLSGTSCLEFNGFVLQAGLQFLEGVQ